VEVLPDGPRLLSLAEIIPGRLVIALGDCVRITGWTECPWGLPALTRTSRRRTALHAYTSADVSEMASQVGAGVDNLSLVALISSAKVTEAALLAGVWDAARVELSFWPFDNPSLGRIVLLTGTIARSPRTAGSSRRRCAGSHSGSHSSSWS